MEGKDAIIQKIIGDANAEAQRILAEASEYADGVIARAKEEASKRVEVAEKSAEKAGVEYISRRVTVAGLDLKKARLNAKMQLLDEVYDKALESLCALPADDYKAIITGMLDSAVSDGDVVTIGKGDGKILTSAFFNAYAKNKGITLTLNKEEGDFKGGIILTGNGVDKNLTFAVELKLLREQTEADIAKVLFKEA